MILIFGLSFYFIAAFNFVTCQVPEPTPPACQSYRASEQDVTKYIFKNFSNPVTRPRLNALHTLDLNLTLSLSAISDVIERERIIRISGYIALRWIDELHRWNHTFPLNCIPYIVLPADRLWLPDVAQMNERGGRYSLMHMPGEKVRLHSNGFTTYSPGGTFEALCDFDFTLFPFDTQKCSIILESWRYTSGYVKFHVGSPTKQYQWLENDQWSLVKTEDRLISETTYTFTEMKFDRVEFHLYLKRKATYYLLNIILPSGIISIAQISVFTLPLGEPMKLEVSFTCLLAYSVFQLIVSNDMPRSSDRVPFLSIFLGLKMFYLALCMLGQGLVFAILKRAENFDEIPNGLYKVAMLLSKVLFVKEPFDLEKHREMWAANQLSQTRRTSAADEQSVYDGVDMLSGSVLNLELKTPKSVRQRRRLFDGSALAFADRLLISPEAAASRRRWIHTAAVVERLNCVIYVSSIVITHAVMIPLRLAIKGDQMI